MPEIKVLASPDFEEQNATLTTGPGVAGDPPPRRTE